MMLAKRSGRAWFGALLVLWAVAAGAFSDAAACAGPPTQPAPATAPGPSAPGEFGAFTPSSISQAAAPLADREGVAAVEGGAAGRDIVVLSDNVSITLAQGSFDKGLEPFEEGNAAFRVDRPLRLVGQLVDGNYSLLSHGGGREAARRNRGVAGHGESVRWWFNGAEQPPLPVVWRAPGNENHDLINGTFFVNDWVPDSGLAPYAGVYRMRFSFAGTRLSYPGLGEFQVYPPCEMAPLNVTVLFPTRTIPRSAEGPSDAGASTLIGGEVRSSDGGRPSGGMVVSDGKRTLGPALPEGLFVDELEVSVPGIPTVVYREGFETGASDWSSGGEGGDWEVGAPVSGVSAYRGRTCLGTGLDGSYSHLADEWVESPSIDLSKFPSEARLTFSLWRDLHEGDLGSVRVWNGSTWSDPVALTGGTRREWTTVNVELGAQTCGGLPFPLTGTTDLKIRFWLESTTPSAVVSDGAFSLEWAIPDDAPSGPVFLDLRFSPDGPYVRSFGNLKLDVRARTRFEIAGGICAVAGGWAEVKGQLTDTGGRPLALPLGRENSGLLQAFWDDGRGNLTEASSVAGPNITGWFACAQRLPPDGKSANASFILRFGGSPGYQETQTRVRCTVRGVPRFEMEPVKAVLRGGEATVSGRLLVGGEPVAGVAVSIRGPSWNASLTTGPDGGFSYHFTVLPDWSGTSLRAVVGFAGGLPAGPGPLEPAERSVEIPVTRRLSVTFDGAALGKGRPVQTTLDGQRFNGLAGKVTDDSGAGAAGVEVAIRALRAGGAEVLGGLRTGQGGYFALEWTADWSEPAGELLLEAVASLPSSPAARKEAVFILTARSILRLDELSPPVPGGWAEVAGTLSEDRDGAPGDPVRDANVAVSFGGRDYTGVTDQSGRFRVRCAVDRSAGNLSVGASFQGGGAVGGSSVLSNVALRTVEAGQGPLRPSIGAPAAMGQAVAAGSFLAVVAGAALIAGTEAGRFKLMLALVPLYSKIRKEEVLDQFVRGQVFGYIQANPGDHYSSIRQTLKLKNGTLAYHVRTLERESFVFSRMDGIFRRFYPSGLDPARVRFKSNVRETHRRILDLIEGSPGITPKELAGKLGASHQVASYHVRVLARRGRVRLEQKGRNTLCYPADGRGGGAGP